MVTFERATRENLRLRMALSGVTGSGKTFSALRIAHGLGKRIAVIDTENGSASKYAGVENPDGGVFEFDVAELTSYSPQAYVKLIEACDAAGYEVLVIDSLSHAWFGVDGALDQKDQASARGGNSYTAWRKVTPMHNAMIDAILGCRAHVIATMRSKMAYVLEQNERGKQVPKKVGLAPVQRDGVEYEFDVVGDIDHEHRLVISKSRCASVTDGVFAKPGRDLAETLAAWLNTGEDPVPTAKQLKALCESLRDAGKLDGRPLPALLAKHGATRLTDLNRTGRSAVHAALLGLQG